MPVKDPESNAETDELDLENFAELSVNEGNDCTVSGNDAEAASGSRTPDERLEAIPDAPNTEDAVMLKAVDDTDHAAVGSDSEKTAVLPMNDTKPDPEFKTPNSKTLMKLL